MAGQTDWTHEVLDVVGTDSKGFKMYVQFAVVAILSFTQTLRITFPFVYDG